MKIYFIYKIAALCFVIQYAPLTISSRHLV